MCLQKLQKTQHVNTRLLLAVFLGVAFVLSNADLALAYNEADFSEICRNTTGALSTDGLGALLTAIAGLGAIIAAAMGGFKMAWGCVVVSVSSFILSGWVELFFGSACS